MDMDWRMHRRYAVDLTVFIFEQGFPTYKPVGIGRVFNISEGGCKIVSDSTFKTGNSIALRIYVPSSSLQILIHVAQVAWSMGTDCGLEFIAIREKEKEHLRNLIDSLEHTSHLQLT